MIRATNKKADLTFNIIVYTLFVLVILMTLYPFWNLTAISFNDPQDSAKGDIYLWPREFSLVSYQTIFQKNTDLDIAIKNSILRTVLGTVLNVFCCSLVAYALSRKKFIIRSFTSKWVFFTMYLTAGIIPIYILYSKLGIINKFAVYILPNLLSGYNIIILRTYMEKLSPSLTEAAYIDGASDAKVFFKVIIPMCVPVIATITLFIAVFQWSAWQDTFLYASNPKAGLTTLQYEMTKIIRESSSNLTEAQIRDMQGTGGAMATPQSLQAAMTIIATVPILIVYPFLQRYFVNGIVLGSVKG